MPTHHCLLVQDGTFAAVGEGGDITGERGASPDGLFARDARHLSRWQLTVDGAAPTVLVPTPTGPTGAVPARATAVLTQPAARTDTPALTLFREQTVREAELTDHIRINGNGSRPVTVLLALTVDADFADQFELRDDHRWYQKPHAVRTRQKRDDGVEFGYRRREWHSRTVVTADPAPDAVEETGSGARRLCWRIELPPHGSTTLRLRVTAHPHGAAEPAGEAPEPRRVPFGEGALGRACAQGDADLAALRLAATGPEGEALRVPAAGVPWFVTLLGRHALITSLLTLDSHPELGHDTLLALAATQATDEAPERIAQPGKIVHEVRHGELAYFQQVPYARYFGSVDATPLFLVLLGAHAERTGDDKLAHRLERHARAAVSWMFDHGGLTEHGYLRYRADEGGLANQSWKDSPDAICFPDGTPARGAIVAAAPQGYAYAALVRAAELAGSVWADPAWAEQLAGAADALRERFLADFWLPEAGFTALALDGEGRRVTTLGSDAGHLLWTGILDAARAEVVGERLLSPAFFSGWGIRTLATGQDAYHPLAYHRGAVWPHDSAIAALGLARHGQHERARTLADGLLALAAAHDYRMPEVITGHGRDDHPAPVPYPHACSPQSWAAATPFALHEALAGP
ncbi:aminotransferase [Streptomyces sp. 3MP-14]|uniref:Aminotransferase n=1 Tax=Streptomyces mimosae TaxID=2586635 RepID=A0A5N6AP30_9ACTN|nr:MULTISPECIES: glycogen debranching N-terminal domain-containing protein [Streptomyces]KAB8169985.1 aminotransferase [Streptomyces mimosae]KAB8178733.1 aminotransferase [Streptomyces sp. 3MP-14]